MTLLADVDARVFCLVCDCSPRDGPELLASAATSKNEMAMRAGERHPIYLTSHGVCNVFVAEFYTKSDWQ